MVGVSYRTSSLYGSSKGGCNRGNNRLYSLVRVDRLQDLECLESLSYIKGYQFLYCGGELARREVLSWLKGSQSLLPKPKNFYSVWSLINVSPGKT